MHRFGRIPGRDGCPFLKAAAHSLDATVQTIEELKREIQVCMFAAGAGDVMALQNTQLIKG
jgi:isopentenyl diphosphate isomerase/L-lactate dehydrogenase-like FMN-dependent dehydrogenase